MIDAVLPKKNAEITEVKNSYLVIRAGALIVLAEIKSTQTNFRIRTIEILSANISASSDWIEMILYSLESSY